MAPRSGEPEPGRRGTRGGDPIGGSGRGIYGARAYTPRGRTVRDAAQPPVRRAGVDDASEPPRRRREPRPERSPDPFRPVLQVLNGGQTAARRGRAAAVGRTTTAGRGGGRTIVARPIPAVEPSPGTGTRRRRPTTTGGGGGRRGAGGAGVRRPPRRPPTPLRLAEPVRRLRLATLLVLVVFITIGIRLVSLQLVDAPEYAGAGLADRTVEVVLPAPRGSIYDRTGAVLARSVEAKYIFADPEEVEDPEAVAEVLSPLLGIARSDLLPRLVRQKRADGRQSQFEYLARGVDLETADRIMKLRLKGIGTGRDERREVPGGDLAANLIGFVSTDLTGLEGLEARYDDLLRGVNGSRVYEVGNGTLRAEIPGGYNKVIEPKPGSSLQLTIDRDLQYEVQRILSTTTRQVNGLTAAAIVLDARSGEVLAQASHPTYDAANWQNHEAAHRADAATSFVVDPGSVHKAIVFGAALEEGVITRDTAMRVERSIVKGDTTFSDTTDPRGRNLSVAGMLGFSSNVGTIKIADQLGAEKLHEYQLKFGLGQPTGVGMPGEAAGRVLEPKQWSGSTYGSVPIGHSVDVTPLQMAAVYAAIANDGTWTQPRLVREIIAPDGTRTPATPPITRQVISPDSAAVLRELLEAPMIIEGGTGRKAAIPGYRVAGKTGTGKRIVAGRYVDGNVTAFIGMDQSDDPRYVIAVFIHVPSRAGGGDVAGPAFRRMMEFTLRHYRVAPTGSDPPNFVVYPR